MQTVYKIITYEDGSQQIQMDVIEQGQPIPEGWTTDYNSLKSKLPPEPVDPNTVLQAKMMAQIAMLSQQVDQLSGGAE